MQTLSIWQKHSFSLSSDFLIIGAGITGLFAALAIRKKFPYASINILERGVFPAGASLKNAGFACFGSPSEILDDAAKIGMERALELVVRRFRGLEKLRRSLSDTETVWQANGGYEVFTHSENEAMKECLDMLPEINRILHNETGLQPYSVVEKNYGMNVLPSLIHIEGEASLHSGELIRQLLSRVKDAGVDVIYSTDVINYERSNGKVRIETANGSTWQCDRLILCTNALTRRLADLDVWPNRGQVLLTEPIPGFKLRGNFHLHQGYFYFRDFEGGILLGGGRHLDRQNEQTDSQETTEIIQMALNELLTRTIIPDTNYQVKLRWAGSMAFGEKNEKEPLVEELESGIYVAVRLGGMGVALAPEVAEKLAAIL